MSRAVFKRNGRDEGFPATGTDRRRNRPNSGPALIAEKRLRFLDQILPAGAAGRRKNDVQKIFYDGL
jgi:hypothetical protein